MAGGLVVNSRWVGAVRGSDGGTISDSQNQAHERLQRSIMSLVICKCDQW